MHDFELMRWIGANSFRTSHYPYAEEWLDYADRHGIVVIDETAAVGLNINMVAGFLGEQPTADVLPDTMNDQTRTAHAAGIRDLIARDKNHPSVIMWCIANEPASSEEGAREYFEPLVALTRELDATRPVTFANQGAAVPTTTASSTSSTSSASTDISAGTARRATWSSPSSAWKRSFRPGRTNTTSPSS